jgi:hypothetical protein
MAASTQSVGSLVIDLRANIAQLQADMDQVKDLVTKSSRQLSSQMKQDMAETRGVLALLRDDFGISLPREMRNIIAASAEARIAIMAVGNAITGLAFVNIGVEVFGKVSEYLTKSQEDATKEAEATHSIAFEAQNAVEATLKRQEALELIGKGEEARAKIQIDFFKKEKERDTDRLKDLQAELSARLAILQAYDAVAVATPDRAASAEAGIDEGGSGATGLSDSSRKLHDQDVQKAKKDLAQLHADIDASTAGIKSTELGLADFHRTLAIQGLKDDTQIALADIELKADTAQRMYAAGKITLDQELMDQRTAATERHNVRMQGLQDELDILQQDPSRNIQQIRALNTAKVLEEKAYQKTLSDLYFQGIEERKKAEAAWEKFQLDASKAVNEAFSKIDKSQGSGVLSLLTASNGATPQLQVDMAGAAIQRFAGTTKDAAEQNKLLEQAMNAMLTPADHFRIIAGDINVLLAKPEFVNSPQVIDALKNQMLLANPEFQKLQQASSEFGKDLGNELDNLILKGESFHDFLQNILKDLADIALKSALINPIEKAFNGGDTGTGGILGGLASLFGFRASGGPVSAGSPYIVGEAGAEMFVPTTSGTIVPNHALGGGDVYNFIIDAKGAAPGTEVAIMRGIRQAMAQNVKKSVAASQDYMLRR